MTFAPLYWCYVTSLRAVIKKNVIQSEMKIGKLDRDHVFLLTKQSHFRPSNVGLWQSGPFQGEIDNNCCHAGYLPENHLKLKSRDISRKHIEVEKKRATISQTTFWNGFLWMKMYESWLQFHWRLFLGVQWTILQYWYQWWLGTDQATSHYLNQWWLLYQRMYASFGVNELSHCVSLNRLIVPSVVIALPADVLAPTVLGHQQA